MKNKDIKALFEVTPESKINLKIELNMGLQNFLHFQKALSNHIDSEKKHIVPQSEKEKKILGDNLTYYRMLCGIIEDLRDELENQYQSKYQG